MTLWNLFVSIQNIIILRTTNNTRIVKLQLIVFDDSSAIRCSFFNWWKIVVRAFTNQCCLRGRVHSHIEHISYSDNEYSTGDHYSHYPSPEGCHKKKLLRINELIKKANMIKIILRIAHSMTKLDYAHCDQREWRIPSWGKKNIYQFE